METSRVQLALNVSDIEKATDFYTDLFGVGPAKQRDGYANFEIADPPLKLVLFEHESATSPLNHLGVEVASSADVVAAAE
jgi:catechol 2,3-dioxygenase-like lactoylglutathione lyase family enzyme